MLIAVMVGAAVYGGYLNLLVVSELKTGGCLHVATYAWVANPALLTERGRKYRRRYACCLLIAFVALALLVSF